MSKEREIKTFDELIEALKSSISEKSIDMYGGNKIQVKMRDYNGQPYAGSFTVIKKDVYKLYRGFGSLVCKNANPQKIFNVIKSIKGRKDVK